MALLWGCGGVPEAPLRVGLLVWPAHEIPFLARDLGRYEGAAIELLDYRSPETLQAYRNGVIDVVAASLGDVLQVSERDPSNRVILVMDYSNGGDAILARRDIRRLADLKGRKAALQPGPSGAYFLGRALDHAGMTAGDLHLVSVEAGYQEEALFGGKVDAVVTCEPTRSKLLARGATELFTSASIPGEIADVLIVRKAILEARREDLRALVAGWFGALAYLKEHPQKAAQQMAPREGLTAEDFLAALRTVTIPDLEANRKLLSGADPALRGALKSHREAMLRLGFLRTSVDTSALLEDSVVTRVRR